MYDYLLVHLSVCFHSEVSKLAGWLIDGAGRGRLRASKFYLLLVYWLAADVLFTPDVFSRQVTRVP